MLVTEFPPQRKDEEVYLASYKVNSKIVKTGESLTDDEAYFQDIVCTVRKKVGGKRIRVNVIVAPLYNMSFHYKTSVQKQKYILLRRITYEKELRTYVIDGKETLDLIKVVELMKNVTDVGPLYEKLVKEFIINISNECNVEGNMEYIVVYDRGKCEDFTFNY